MAKPMPKNPWPGLLILMGAFFLALTAWSVYRAATRGSGVMDPDYYRHGLRFNDALLQQQAAQGLGWVVVAEIRDGWVRCRLTTPERLPVSGGEGNITLFHVRSGTETRVPLREIEPGIYAGKLPAGLSGQLPAILNLRLGKVRWRKNLLLDF